MDDCKRVTESEPLRECRVMVIAGDGIEGEEAGAGVEAEICGRSNRCQHAGSKYFVLTQAGRRQASTERRQQLVFHELISLSVLETAGFDVAI